MNELVNESGKELAKKTTQEMLKRISNIYEKILGSYRVLDQEIIIQCPELLQKYNIIFEIKRGVRDFKIRFPFGKPIRVNLKPVISLQDLHDAVSFTDDGFEIKTENIGNYDTFVLSIEYALQNSRFLDALIYRNVAKELPKDRENEYWMQAQLKHPKVFQTKFGKLDLRDIDFNIDVGVSENIKTVVPTSFKRELETSINLLREKERSRKYRLAFEHIRAMRSRGEKNNIIDVLGDLQELFVPKTFSKFIDVKKDFYYYNCHRGTNFYETVPFPTWPKSMKVISRTDLNLEKFAAEGILVYKKFDFIDEACKIFGIKN